MTGKHIHILLFFAALLWMSCRPATTEKTHASGPDKTTVPSVPVVRVVQPERRSFEGSITLTGTAMANRKVHVYALEAGQVRRMLTDIGKQVKQGQLLAVLSNPEVSRMYEMVKVALEYARKDYERLKGIHEQTPDLISIREVEKAEAQYKMKEAELAKISSRMAQLRIRAPFAGIVTKRYVDKGALVQNSLQTAHATPIVDILDAGTIRLTVYLPEADVPYIHVGSVVRIHFPELGDEVIAAKVTRSSGALDPASKNMTVEIDLQNKAHKIKPGMFARVEFLLNTGNEVLSLPQESLVLKNDANYVYVVKDGYARLVEIKKGLEDKAYFQVISGVTEGDKVVVKGKNTISDGQKVQIVK